MTRRSRTPAIVLAALMLTSLAAVFTPTTGAQADTDVPVDYASASDTVALNLWRDNEDNDGACVQTDQATGGTCVLRVEQPPARNPARPHSEVFNVRSSADNAPDPRSAARFILDTNAGTSTPDGAAYPFTIQQGTSALKFAFHYDSEAVCDSFLTGEGQQLQFHVDFHRATSDPGQTGDLGTEPFANTTRTVCNLPAGGLRDPEGYTVSGAIDLPSPVSFAAGEFLVVQIYAVNPEIPNAQWALLFEDATFNSRIELRTPQAVQAAVWAGNKAGDLVTSFSPTAPSSERFMVGYMALRSPFGGDAVPSRGFTGAIIGPGGSYVDLDPASSTMQREVNMAEKGVLRENSGARKVFSFANPGSFANQPWNYPQGVDTGRYQLEIVGELLGQSKTLTRSVAMGSFDFELTPVQGEQTIHQLRRSSSTTFILNLTNNADIDDAYQIDASFEFASRGVWGVDIAGVDQNDRVSLQGRQAGQATGETALLQVKLTPPDEARSGDAARVVVTAESQTSSTTRQLVLEGQITTQNVADVGLLVLRDTFTVGIDRENRVDVFAWNKGTTTDSLTARIVNGSLTPDDPGKFRADVAQNRFDGITPGALVRVPLTVTTTDDVVGGETFQFDVEVVSRNQPAETATGTVRTAVEAVRAFEVFGFNGDNEVLESRRFGKWNGDSAFCQNLADNPEECDDFTRYAFHRFEVTNVGDQPESFRLENTTASYFRSSNNCDRVLPDAVVPESSGIYAVIDHSDPDADRTRLSRLSLDPGETKHFYYQLTYDGEGVAPDCDWDRHRVGIKVVPETTGLPAKTLTAETTVYSAGQIADLPRVARAQPVLLGASSAADQLVQDLPDFTGLEPGMATDIPLTLGLQDGHEDQARLSIGPQNRIADLRDAGWEIELLAAEGVPFDPWNATDADLLVPANSTVGTSEDGSANTSIGHASGAEFPLLLRVTAPTEGLEENERHTFTVAATSVSRPSVRAELGVGVQIGQDFGFDLSAGTDSLQAHAGDTVAFALTIENTGASRDTYALEPASGSTLSDVNIQPSTVSVSPRSSKVVSVVVDVPDGASQGTHTLSVVASSQSGRVEDKQVSFTVDVRPEGTLNVQAQDPLVRIGPGGETSINFTIENEAAEPRSVELSQVFAPPGWTTTLDQSTTRTIAGSGSITLTYLVQAPDNIVEDSRYTFVIRAQDVDDPSDFANGVAFAVSQQKAAVSLEPEQRSQVVDRGGSTTFDVLVRNIGTGPTWFLLDTGFESNGWSSRVLDQDGSAVDNATIRVAEKTFKRVQIEVTAPEQVARDHVEPVRLTATAVGDADARDQVQLSAEVHDFDIALEITGATTRDAAPGDNVEYELSITNEGNGPDRVRLSFEDPTGADPQYPVSTDLAEDRTPELEPGETLTGIRITVAVPSPNQAPVPTADGITSVVRATSSGQLPDGGSPTVAAQVITKLVEYVRFDVDGDGAFELALDLDRTLENGFEAFADKDDVMVERGEISRSESIASEGLYALDGDGDDRREHLVDTDGDGISDQYLDPDKAQTSEVTYTIDVNEDSTPEEPIDTDFDGLIDRVYDTGTGEVQLAANHDVSGDGRRDLLIDTTGNEDFDTFVDPNQNPHVITKVEKHGDRYHIDSDGDGKVDTYYNAQTQTFEPASTADLKDFLVEYWYFLVLFALVVVLFVVIVVRRL